MEPRCLVGANIAAHAAAVHREDVDGRLGVSLIKALSKAAVRDFTENLQRLAPRVLPTCDGSNSSIVCCRSGAERQQQGADQHDRLAREAQ